LIYVHCTYSSACEHRYGAFWNHWHCHDGSVSDELNVSGFICKLTVDDHPVTFVDSKTFHRPSEYFGLFQNLASRQTMKREKE
jgi:hypothetical protein